MDQYLNNFRKTLIERNPLLNDLLESDPNFKIYEINFEMFPDIQPLMPPIKSRKVEEYNGQSPVQMTAEEIVEAVKSTNVDRQLDGMQAARKMLSREGDPPIELMIDHGIVPIAIQFLQNYDNPSLQFEAAWVLTNIASGSSAQTRCVVDNNAVPHLVDLLKSNSDVTEQAVWALRNIAGDGPSACDILLDYNVIENILPLCPVKLTEMGFLGNIQSLMFSLVRNKPQLQENPAIQTLSTMMFQSLMLLVQQDLEARQ